MISYKVRLAFLQYLPKKPHKWGMKAWLLAESKTGYTWNWDLYTGKVDHQDNDLPLGTQVMYLKKDTIFFLIISIQVLTYADCFMRKAVEVVALLDLIEKEFQNRLKTTVLRRVK